MHPILVERIPTRPFGLNPLAVAFKVSLAGSLIEDVMFAGDIEGVEPRLLDSLISLVELLRFGNMSDIARVNHEGGLLRQLADLRDGLLERRHRIGICRPFKTDMAVGNLQECEGVKRLRPGFRYSEQRR